MEKGRNCEDISFEMAEIGDCKPCFDSSGVYSLWVNMKFAEQKKPQVGINAPKVSINTQDKQLTNVVKMTMHTLVEQNKKILND